MDKQCSIVACSTTDSLKHAIDWSLCVICQRAAHKKALVCPGESKLRKTGDGYLTLESDLLGFKSVNSLPSTVNLNLLNDGSGIGNTLRENRGRWHKSCRDALNSTKLERARKRKLDEVIDDNNTVEYSLEQEAVSRSFTRAFSAHSTHSFDNKCFLCETCDDTEKLWQVRTFGLDSRVREYAAVLNDVRLLSKLSEGDLIAREAKYHARCLVAFYNRASRVGSADSESTVSNSVQKSSIALAELIAYIEDVRSNETIAPVFRLSELAKLYASRLNQLGVAHDAREHSTRLKQRIMNHFPDMIEVCGGRGRGTNLMFDEDLSIALSKACTSDSYADAMHLVRAAQIIRRDTVDNRSKYGFQGVFSSDCQKESVPASLLTLVNMILEGPCIDEVSEQSTAAALSISQLIVHNSIKRNRNRSVNMNTIVRHSKSQDTPLPIYIAMLIHSVTRRKSLVDKLFNLGICVSYDRMLQISTDAANVVCTQYAYDDVVCPVSLRTNLFTLAAIDNIDHNPSSSTSSSSFHGTSISLIQNRFDANDGLKRVIPDGTAESLRKIQTLPTSYTTVEPVSLISDNNTIVPAIEKLSSLIGTAIDISDILSSDAGWLDKVLSVTDTCDTGVHKTISSNENLSWAAYNANLRSKVAYPAITALLPLFREAAHSSAMIKHGMKSVKCAVKLLNSDQIPVITFDQPLYAIAKLLQWREPLTFGENQFIILLGGLHIEMAAWKTIGDWLEGSGWTDALVDSKVASVGTADSFLKCSHIKKTRQAHTITAATLYILQKQAYELYKSECTDNDRVETFDSWCQLEASRKPLFAFWSITLQLELTILAFVRSIRDRNFELYVNSLRALVPWFFALDHIHYARWTPVHIRDMVTLAELHPSVAAQFQLGNFTVQKTKRAFSAISVDHAHEQANKLIKEEGGAVGLTESEQALRRWMVAGPEISRMLNDFENATEMDTARHHEQTAAHQKSFLNGLKSLIGTFQELGNPFCDSGVQLLSLHSKIIVHKSASNVVNNIYHIGSQQYSDFVQERLITNKMPIQAPIHRNKFQLFSTASHVRRSAIKDRLCALKNDCVLFSRLYIASQTRGSDIDEFFAHENQAFPPSLCSNGNLRQGTKSDLLKCLKNISNVVQIEKPPIECVIIDGAAIVQILKPSYKMSFIHYAKNVFMKHIYAYLENSARVDVVFDVYKSDSLKAGCRVQRGSGVRRRVTPEGKVPSDWFNFLRVDENKTELFDLLSSVITETEISGKLILSTAGDSVVCCPSICTESLSPCSHEEADTRMILHAADAAKTLKHVMIRTVDTDVVVLAVSFFEQLHLDTLWIAFGVGKNFHYISAHSIAVALGTERSSALPIFHALTGCDTVSSFCGRGKSTAFDTWTSYPAVTEAFLHLRGNPFNVTTETVQVIERFVVLMYDKTSESDAVNVCRKELFARKNRSIENIPPTKNALELHIKRAIYQSVHVWGNSLLSQPTFVSPLEWGWDLDEGIWNPVWITVPQASQICSALVKCACKQGCKSRCKCYKACLQCTSLCGCEGDCRRNNL